jgi:hypothetical protein
VENFDSVELEMGKGPGATTLEEHVDGGGNVEVVADIHIEVNTP